MSLNDVRFIGRMGSDISLNSTKSGDSVGNFSLATSKGRKDINGVWQNKTTWHRITVWGATADYCQQRLGKGSLVYVAGELQYNDWEDKNGNKRTTAEISAFRVIPLEKRSEATSAEENASGQQQDMLDKNYNIEKGPSFTTDDVPF